MLKTTASEICSAVNGKILEGNITTPVTGVSTDSREIRPGMAFIALKGERYDGHIFIGDALRKGAAAAIGEFFNSEVINYCRQGQVLIKVQDTLAALQGLASYHRNKIFTGPLIAVTGSSGKTTTKNVTASILSPNYRVLKTQGNFNNEIGLPLTLLNITPEHQVVVVEMAMRGRGEIKHLCEIARPNIGIITNIGTAHLELLGSKANIAAAKGELLDSLPVDGAVVLNGDDEWCRRLAASCKGRVIFYGIKGSVDIVAREIDFFGPNGTSFTAVFPGEEIRVHLPVPGMHNIYNTLAGLAAGYLLGLKPFEMLQGLRDWPVEDLRQELRTGPGGCIIYNDSYNANPESMKAVLQAVASFPGRKVAVLGDMYELGDGAAELHRQIGRVAHRTGLYRLITVGKLAREIAAGAIEAGMPAEKVFICTERSQAVKYLKDLGTGDVVLFKGSRLAGMEKVLSAWESDTGD